ncbi:response regulator transcription factor [Paenibacillus piri]|uniref:Response regulator transcription factor n=1 Tax=Paenibacillus piri TaxID=2547395 RepID=A0A4R5KGK7_9BACL|nr:response regulator transcription factor [Paenibacillus piri]TDF93835.1 response regulator transcription factor [Paenibacillus piri]
MIKLLIAEDDGLIREGLKCIIDWHELGIEIAAEARNGLEALDLFRETDPHIVLTDIRMPHNDGLELIENIRAGNSGTKIVVISGYDDYQYVRQAMKYQVEDYLLKPIDPEELKEIMKTCCQQIENDFIRDQMNRESFQLLKNNVFLRWVENRIDPNQLREKLDLLKIDFMNADFYQVCVITWHQPQEGTLSAEEINFRSFAILNIMEEHLDKLQRGYAFLNNDRHIVCILGGYGEQEHLFVEQNYNLLNQLCMQYSSMLKSPWYCTLGKLRTQIHHVHFSYQDALSLQDYMNYSDFAVCLDEQHMQLVYPFPEEEFPSLSCRDSILHAVLAGNREIWNDFIERDFRWVQTQPKPLAAGKYIAMEWLVWIKQNVRNGKIPDMKPFMKVRHVADIVNCGSAQELKGIIYNVLIQAEEICQGQLKSPKMTIIDQIKQYVLEHYDQQLSVQILADEFHLNNIYLGRLFKEQTGEYFSDYLNKIRINKAKELLETTYLKAADIAVRVGFLDPNYFYRKFKQITGVSPIVYRNMNK